MITDSRAAVRELMAAMPGLAMRAVFVVLVAIACAWFLVALRDVLVLAFVALIVAAGALGPTRWLEMRGVPRPLAVAIVYLAVAVVLVLIVFVVVPPLLTQLVEFASGFPALLRAFAERYGPTLASLGLPTDSAGLVNLAASEIGGLAAGLSTVPLAIAGVVANAVTVVFLSAFFLLERTRGRDWTLRFVAPGDRPTLVELAEEAAQRLGLYVRGQLLIMSVTGAGSAIGLTLLGVPFALPLGFLAFLTEAIPLAGPIIAGVVMVGVALTESPGIAAATALLVIALQQVEGLVLVPIIQGRAISISPAVALLAVLAGSALGGIVGAVVAIPLVAIVTVGVDNVVLPWRRRQIRSIARQPPPVKNGSEGVET